MPRVAGDTRGRPLTPRSRAAAGCARGLAGGGGPSPTALPGQAASPPWGGIQKRWAVARLFILHGPARAFLLHLSPKGGGRVRRVGAPGWGNGHFSLSKRQDGEGDRLSFLHLSPKGGGRVRRVGAPGWGRGGGGARVPRAFAVRAADALLR